MIEVNIAWYRKLSSKFIALTILISLIPMAFVYYYATNSASEMLIDVLKNELKEKTFLVGADIDRYFGQKILDVNIISQPFGVRANFK